METYEILRSTDKCIVAVNAKFELYTCNES